MAKQQLSFKPVKLSLEDLTGAAYISSVCAGRSVLAGEGLGDLKRKAKKKGIKTVKKGRGKNG